MLSTLVGNLAIRIRLAAEAGQRFELPLVEKLLKQAEFATLKAFVEQSLIDPATVQRSVDELVNRAQNDPQR